MKNIRSAGRRPATNEVTGTIIVVNTSTVVNRGNLRIKTDTV